MSDCTAIYPAKPIECLRDAGHDGDHAGQDDAGFQVYWSKPNAAYVPASALDAANEALRAANEENKRLRALVATFLDADNSFAPPSTMDAHRRNLIAALAPKES